MTDHINLNNEWKYVDSFQIEMTQVDFDETNMKEIRLPHTNVETPYHYFDEKIYQFISCYRRHLKVCKDWKGKKILLTFEGIGHIAKIYINSRLIETHYGGYTAFTIDLAPYLKFPTEEADLDNILAVEVDSRESNNLPPFGFVIDYMTFGGIYREAYIDIKEEKYIEDVFIVTEDGNNTGNCNITHNTTQDITQNLTQNLTQDITQDSTLKKTGNEINQHNPRKENDTGNLLKEKYTGNQLKEYIVSLQVSVPNVTANHACQLRYKVLDIKSEKEYYADTYSIKEKISKISFQVQGVENWDLNHPTLYCLQLELFDTDTKESLLDTKTVRFGFRTTEFKEDGFYLNHKRIKLIGLNRHQSFPYVGYAMPKRMQQRDAEILKNELQVNAVRTSHYPQSRHFIDRCDELGLLVFTEIPGWQHIGDERWKELACENVADMVLQYRNHPSIVLWGVRINESQDDDEFYTKTNQIAHELDPSRQTGGVRFLQKSSFLEDVYTFNDFHHNGSNQGINKKKKVSTKPDAPYLVSEFNGHMFPTKSFDSEEHRLDHALRHAKVLDGLFEQKGVAGGFGWCMFDYNTHKDFGSGDRICYHGVLDMFRNSKLAAAVYASQNELSDVCEVSSSMDIGDHPIGNIGDIYAFTNADSVKLYKNDIFIKEFFPNQKKYPSLPHAPILIDDFVGDLMEKQEHYSHRTAEGFKSVLGAITRYGLDSLPLWYQMRMGLLMLQNHLTFADGARLYYQYAGSWGGEVPIYRFEAVKNERIVKTVCKKPVIQPRLNITTDTLILHEEETYDVATIRILAEDENGNRLPYYQEPIMLTASGVIEIIGPKSLSLKGGAGGTYVKTTGISGEGQLKIYQENLGETLIEFIVK